jgi:hypothetical protein
VLAVEPERHFREQARKAAAGARAARSLGGCHSLAADVYMYFSLWWRMASHRTSRQELMWELPKTIFEEPRPEQIDVRAVRRSWEPTEMFGSRTSMTFVRLAVALWHPASSKQPLTPRDSLYLESHLS